MPLLARHQWRTSMTAGDGGTRCGSGRQAGIQAPVLAVQIAPRVFQVAAPFEGDGLVNCYFIDASRKALIDTGTASVPSNSLLPALKELGWDPSELRVIINTHMHIDHAGGNAEMQERSGASIHMHRADTELIDRQKHLDKYARDDMR